MDLSNTAVRWINLDSQPAKSGDSPPPLGYGKTVNQAFSDNLKAVYYGQKVAHSGNTLPNEEQQADTIKLRVLKTDVNPVLSNLGKTSNPQAALYSAELQSSKNSTNQADLISEISAFNKGALAHNSPTSNKSMTEEDKSLRALTASVNAKNDQQTSLAEGSTITNTPEVFATTSLAAAPRQTQIAQQLTQAGKSTEDSAVKSKVTSGLQVQPRQSGANTGSVALNLAASSGMTGVAGEANPLTAEIQLVAIQAKGKQSLKERNSSKAAQTSAAGQEFKLPNTASKQVPIKLVMVEASATVQQWQKLKQMDSDTTDSSVEAPSTLLQSESRTLKASPELQAARLVKTEQDAQALSQKFAEQLGQRLIQSVQKGHWRAELELHPKSLGRIDVRLDFVNGQLEGHFQTHNPATRELLQESLPRLREWLQQTGTQVASLEVNNGNSGQGGEKPTPQMFSGRKNDAVTDESAAELASQEAKPQALNEGFDLLV